MANILGILTAVVLAFATYIAVKNKEKTKEVIDSRVKVENDLSVSKVRYEKATTALTDANNKLTQVKADIVTLDEQAAAQRKVNEELILAQGKKSEEVTASKTKLDELKEKVSALGSIKELGERMTSVASESSKIEQSMEEAKARVANITSETLASSRLVAAKRSDLERVSKGESPADLRTRVRSLYPSWGFVVLADGSNKGVASGSSLNVIRDGQKIGQLLVTSVETSTSSASMVPDSFEEGVTIQAGDEVVPSLAGNAKDTKP